MSYYAYLCMYLKLINKMANTSQQTTFRQIQGTRQGPFSNAGIQRKNFHS